MTSTVPQFHAERVKTHKKAALIGVLLWPIAASFLSFLFNAGVLLSTALFFGVPALYLSYRCKKHIAKAALFSLLVTVPVATIVDYIMEHTRGWRLPSSVFGSFRLFGYVTIEQYIWLFLYVYLVVMFYEAFLESPHRAGDRRHPRLKWLFIALAAPLGVFLAVLAVNHSLLAIDYFYLKFGVLMIAAPVIFLVFRLPALLGRILKAGAYFFFLSLIYEVTALALRQWEFPAENQFIGMISVFGMRFPFEEFFFWILLGAVAALAYYEFFDDDRQ
ncbi:MAG TPA: hypothetical protein DEF00_01420 [Candidatus Taylorbacteria bacterium]|nr:MAG: hypothetical protein UY03_C0014G0019 [Parcubacteria group bacterium GW2011_GWA2_47_64]KKU97055.1 MAG: hypothetical protein UY29_C0003G0052 [Parcubacteria group bacterium GW2011_GWC2_48_17]HBV01037.1 hypothetical protein [Candidatus Taylorbacteria bacterium]